MEQKYLETGNERKDKRIGKHKYFDIDPILALPEVLRVTSLKKTALYKMMEVGGFPRQIRLGPRRVGWRKSDVREWVESRPYVSRVFQDKEGD